MLFIKISYLDLQRLFCPAKQTFLYNFGRGHYLEHSCEIILNSDQWFLRCCLKDYLSRALGALLSGGADLFVQFW